MPEEVFDGMSGEPSDLDPVETGEVAVADVNAELAEAEGAEADALAEAGPARARPAEAGTGSGPRRRVAESAGLAVAALVTGVALTLTGLMLWQHAKAGAEREQEQRFVDAARDGVVALLSIDYNRARDDVQRVLDLSTGQFHDDFGYSADDFVKTAVDSQAVTTGTVNAAALDVVDGDRARVLVSATSVVSNARGAKRDARPFRMSVTVTRDGDTCKMSDVEFVP